MIEMRKFCLTGLICLFASSVDATGIFSSIEDANTYYPLPVLHLKPKDVGMNYEDVYIEANGVRLYGWFISVPKAQGTLLFMYGGGGNMSFYLDRVDVFKNIPMNVFIFDYRGFGQSTGKPSEEGLYQDAQAAFKYLTQERKIPPKKIVIYGFSLGAAIAVDLASRIEASGVIVDSCFSSSSDFAREYHPGWIVQLMVKSRYDSISKIGNIQMPILIIHSLFDEAIPFGHALRLYEAAPAHTWFAKLSGSHAYSFRTDQEVYARAVGDFVRHALNLK